MEVLFSEEFRREFEKIRDNSQLLRIAKAIKKLEIMPECGKPLTHDMKGHRRLVIAPFRLIYRIEDGKVLLVCFDHRKTVYR